MPVTNLSYGQKATIRQLGPSLVRVRLLELGAVPGSEIERVMGSSLGGNGCYRICGALIALREDDAATIDVY